jgi:hypothetical protein
MATTTPIVYGLDEIALVPTPVELITYGATSRERRTVIYQKALLYSAKTEGTRGRAATVWLENIYGKVLCQTGRLQFVEVQEANSRWSTPEITLAITVPPKRNAHYYTRPFPLSCLIIAWGAWKTIDLPCPLESEVLSQNPQAFRRHWEDVRDVVNGAAESAVWLDTTTTTVDGFADRFKGTRR